MSSERRARVRLVVIIAVVAAAVLILTAVLARQPDEPRIELIDVVEDGAPPSDGVVRLAVTTAVAAGPASPPASTAPTTVPTATSTTATSTTTTSTTTTTTTTVPVTTAAPIGDASAGNDAAPPTSGFTPASVPVAQEPLLDPADSDAIAKAIDDAQAYFAPIVRATSAEDPLRVYVGGDSLSDAPRWGLDRATANITVTADTRISTGIVADWYFDWVDRVATNVVPNNYDVVVLTMGGNDAQRFDPNVAVGSEEWKAEYRRRVDSIFAMLADGPLVVWIGMPPVTPDNIRPAIAAANEVTSELAAAWPHVEYVDAYALFAGEDNDFATRLARQGGEVQQVRAPDGVHYTPAAGVWLADEVLALISARMVEPSTLVPAG